MKLSIDENIGDEVILGDHIGKIISILITGPLENISYEISYWDEASYKVVTLYKFEFKIKPTDKRKAGY